MNQSALEHNVSHRDKVLEGCPVKKEGNRRMRRCSSSKNCSRNIPDKGEGGSRNHTGLAILRANNKHEFLISDALVLIYLFQSHSIPQNRIGSFVVALSARRMSYAKPYILDACGLTKRHGTVSIEKATVEEVVHIIEIHNELTRDPGPGPSSNSPS
ncbi:hypothetical protein VNO77_03360 [Canavalia gladiata]|uniref:Uncharacterized protein n=1 Tax=Canavalia gladiata TaxID=3824 RepID=A0AAN9R3T2_CANGL